MISITKDNMPKNCVFNVYDNSFKLRKTVVFIWFDGQSVPHVFWHNKNGKLNGDGVYCAEDSYNWLSRSYKFKMVQSHVTNMRQIDFKKCKKIVRNCWYS